jgi:hypothetical protein
LGLLDAVAHVEPNEQRLAIARADASWTSPAG